jgi:rhodanese-related sulfurtransferase
LAVPFETSPQDVKRRIDAGERIRLIDVREPQEHATAALAGAELIPMRTVPARLQHLEAEAEQGPLIVFCHHGMRSLQVVSWLREQGVENCQSMAGGIDLWSATIDPAVPRY